MLVNGMIDNGKNNDNCTAMDHALNHAVKLLEKREKDGHERAITSALKLANEQCCRIDRNSQMLANGIIDNGINNDNCTTMNRALNRALKLLEKREKDGN